MNSFANLKSPQLRKLFLVLQSSLMQNLRIFLVQEAFHFEYTILS
jgi:hypothetical protein